MKTKSAQLYCFTEKYKIKLVVSGHTKEMFGDFITLVHQFFSQNLLFIWIKTNESLWFWIFLNPEVAHPEVAYFCGLHYHYNSSKLLNLQNSKTQSSRSIFKLYLWNGFVRESYQNYTEHNFMSHIILIWTISYCRLYPFILMVLFRKSGF